MEQEGLEAIRQQEDAEKARQAKLQAEKGMQLAEQRKRTAHEREAMGALPRTAVPIPSTNDATGGRGKGESPTRGGTGKTPTQNATHQARSERGHNEGRRHKARRNRKDADTKGYASSQE
jgi:hypothetical protein